jgi:hypothetical protein
VSICGTWLYKRPIHTADQNTTCIVGRNAQRGLRTVLRSSAWTLQPTCAHSCTELLAPNILNLNQSSASRNRIAGLPHPFLPSFLVPHNNILPADVVFHRPLSGYCLPLFSFFLHLLCLCCIDMYCILPAVPWTDYYLAYIYMTHELDRCSILVGCVSIGFAFLVFGTG